MKANTKSSVTLPAEELRLVKSLKARLHLRSNVEVVRRGLRLLAEATDRAALKEAYRQASRAVRAGTVVEIDALDHLAGEGIE
jgi:Arc/MetJ-type ribon-helix-helix transcriptional regulator